MPVPVARAIAAAIRDRRAVTLKLCACNCGQPVTQKATAATPACRKRLERRRRTQAEASHAPAQSHDDTGTAWSVTPTPAQSHATA